MRPLARRRMLPWQVVARAWCALVAVAVLFGIVQARTRYYYCDSLGLSASDPCAHEVTRGLRCPLASFDRAPFDCCEVITMPSMPEGARAAPRSVPPAGVIAVLPAIGGSVESSCSAGARVAWERERWRGPSRASRERRAQLMVFLT